MTTIYTHTNCNIAYEIKAIQNICKGTKKDVFTLWRESGMDFNHFNDVLAIMVDGMMITKLGNGCHEEAYIW